MTEIMRCWIATLTVACCFPAVAHSQTSDHEPAAGSLQSWIEMLESPRYSDRAEASAKLGRLGVSAIDALLRVTRYGAVEASDRAFEILKRHYHSSDEVLKSAAADALKQIADETNHPKSKSAQRLLQPTASPSPNAVPLRQLPIFAPRAINANRRIQIQIKVTNGKKDVTVEENGKKTRVTETGQGLEVEKSDGQGGITKKKYKDAAELKLKDPEAHQAYQRGGGGRIQIRGIIEKAPPALPGKAIKRHEEIFQRHQEMRKKHEKMLEERRKRQLPRNQPLPRKPIELDAPDVNHV